MTDPVGMLAGLGVPAAALTPLESLPAEDQLRFAETVAAAVGADTERVEKALDATLRLVPAPLRGRARALLFPEDGA